LNYSIVYFASLIDANANAPEIPTEQLTSYKSSGNQTIYVKIKPLSSSNTICNNLFSFDLLVKSFVTNQPQPISICIGTAEIATIDLTLQNASIINGQNSSNFNFSYYLTKEDAQKSTLPILNPRAFTTTDLQSPTRIWVRVEDILGKACFQLVSFDIIVHQNPPIDSIASVVECNSYVLPTLVNGNYFTGSNGTGTPLFAGDIITNGGTYYIYNTSPDNVKCTNQSSFNIVLIDELVFSTTACGTYKVPFVPYGNFFTEPGGAGTLLSAGTSLTSNQLIYYYAFINGQVCREEALTIIITPLPVLDSPLNVITCDTYVLPRLNNGNYFTESEGKGKALFAGDVIKVSQDIYVFGLNGICSNQNKFRVNIVDTSIYTEVRACGEFVLPPIPFGNYYDQPLGKGTLIPVGTVITSSKNIYYYVETTTFPNCTDNLYYQITIKPKPILDQVSNRIECERYILPPLINGNYYTATNGGGVRLNPGDIITKTQTIYVFAIGTNGCSNEKSFTVEIRPLPAVDNFSDVFTCDPFVLPRLTNGSYYTASGGPHGEGIKIDVGSVISSTQKIFIYNEWNDLKSCSNESFFKVEVLGIDVGTFPDINACDSYTLPALSIGNYYSQANGQGSIISSGTVLHTTQTIYVYATVGNRLTCSDEDSFIVSISTTPVLNKHSDIEACGSYTLPVLEIGNYFSGPNETGTAYFAGQNISTSQKLYVYAKSPTNVMCYDQYDFNLIIHPLNNIKINGGVICVDNKTGKVVQSFELVSGLDPVIFTVDWYLKGVLMGTGSNYTAVQEGIYDVIITKNTPDIGNLCGYNPAKAIVETSSKAIATVAMTGSFEDNIDVIVTVTGGFGIYEYQLDNGIFQTDTTFHSLTSGKHSITIKDTKGDCGITVVDITVLKYPKYFTPNADGYNDTWNILDLSLQADALIYIYDRYGKLIKQIAPSGQGWDGTYNGQELPATDYWFQVFYKIDGVDHFFKSNFSLKR
jgi:gliding motility-associated-like protein